MNNTVVILSERTARIRSNEGDGYQNDISVVTREDPDRAFMSINRWDDEPSLDMSRDEAEALFLVLDTMLHPDEVEAEGSFAAGVDPDFDDYDVFDIPVFDPR